MIDKQRAAGVLISFALVASGCAPERDTASTSPNVPNGEDAATNADKFRNAPWLKDTTSRPMTLLEARDRFDRSYHLKPDRRLLIAVADCYALVFGRTGAEAKADFVDGKWMISCGGIAAGAVSEIPELQEMLNLLRAWCITLKQRNAFTLSDSERLTPAKFSPPELVLSLKRAGVAWNQGRHDKQILVSSARDLVYLTFLSTDSLGVSDRLAGRALASLAAASALTGNTMLRETSLLAEALQYFNFARAAAKSLPASDRVRMYVERQVDGLSGLQTVNDKEVRYLYLRLLGQKRMKSRWQECVRKYFADDSSMTLPVLGSAIDLSDETSLMPLGSSIMAATNRELTGGGKSGAGTKVEELYWTYEQRKQSTEWMLRDLVSEFESGLATLESNTSSPFFDSGVIDGYYRGYFYSAVDVLVQAYAELPSARNVLENFAQSLRVKDDRPAKELERWLKDRIEVMKGERNFQRLFDDISGLNQLGTPAVIALAEDIERVAETTEFERILAMGPQVLGRTDTRPAARADLCEVVETLFLNPLLAHKLNMALLKSGEPSSLAARVKYLLHLSDVPGLIRLLGEPVLTAGERLSIISYLKNGKLIKQDLLGRELRKLMEESNYDWPPTSMYLEFLGEGKRFSELDALSRQLIARYVGKDTLNEARVRAVFAGSLYQQGKFAEGLRELGKSTNLEQFESLRMKALLLNATGKKDEGQTWAKEALKRYPRSEDAQALVAELLWQDGKYHEAARSLSENLALVSSSHFKRKIGSSFARTFKDDVEKGLLAVRQLKDEGIDGARTLGVLAEAAFRNGQPELAFKTLSFVKAAPSEVPDALTVAYRYLKVWRGKSEAIAWLGERLPPPRRHFLAPFAFITGQDELLWDFIQVGDSGPEFELVWLLRTATSIYDSSDSTGRHQKIIEHYRQSSDMVNSAIARSLLDKNGASSLYSLKLSNEDLCRSAFYAGWKSLNLGRNFYSDVMWYRLALDTGAKNTFEYEWSLDWMRDVIETIHIKRGKAGGREDLLASLKVTVLSEDKAGRRRYLFTGRDTEMKR